MSQPSINIRYVANLARLDLSDEEVAQFEPQMASILEYMRTLDVVDVAGVEPTAHANPVLNVTRADEARPSMGAEAALANAPQTALGQFVVPKVVE